MPRALRTSCSALLAAVAACAPPAAPEVLPAPATPLTFVPELASARPEAVGLDPSLGARLDSIATASMEEGTSPGMVIGVGRHGRLVHLRGYGRTGWGEEWPETDAHTIYDLASLTKVVATTTAAMMLEEEGRLVLDSTVAFYLPEFGASPEKRPITVRMLLTHTGGLEAFAQLFLNFRGREQYLAQITQRPLRSPPGTQTVYSDWDLILLQLVLERIVGQPLDHFVRERIFEPLQMTSTWFTPHESLRPRIAPTAVDTTRGGGGLLHGVVHDGNAWAIGGVSGHAGLFSSMRDLTVFAQFMLNGGRYGSVQLLRPQTIARWTAPQLAGSSRALGWDTPAAPSSAGRFASPRSFGHTGFTGTSMWMDPERGLFVIILANRVHPRGMSSTHIALRRNVADAVQQAVFDAPVIHWEPPAP